MTMGALKLDDHKPTDDVVTELDGKLRPGDDHPDVIAFFETDTRNDEHALWHKLKATIQAGNDEEYDCTPIPYVPVGTSQRLVALLVCVRLKQVGDQDEPRLRLRADANGARLDQAAPQVSCPAGSDSAKAVISRTVLLDLLEADTDEIRPVRICSCEF